MEQTQQKSYESLAHRHQHSVESVITLFEWLVVAFILALTFMAFAMQAFQIPTGSMAETLRGEHYHTCCFRCGWPFDTNTGVSNLPKCPNCDYTEPSHAFDRMNNGDRIFVLKSIYQFSEPKRWDVVVFKNPLEPKINFIKRLIALPGETVQLVNGDVYINGRIARKPINVQKEQWMPIFLQDYQPLAATDYFNETRYADNRPWKLPFENEPNSAWNMDRKTVFKLTDEADKQHTMVFTPYSPDEFRAFYAYNQNDRHSQPMVTDLMVNFYAKCDDTAGFIGASLEKYGVLYSAKVAFDGEMTFTKTVNGQTTLLTSPTLTGGIVTGRFEKFEFANVDQRLVLRWGDKRFTYDLSADEYFQSLPAIDKTAPAVKIFARGETEIRHIGLYRDIFYRSNGILRATRENPFTLDKDQFFVCGDNSNDSYDGRSWDKVGTGNGRMYRMGVVPRDYLMGKAVMVYWSQAFKPVKAQRIPSMIPNLDNLKVIYGSSETEY